MEDADADADEAAELEAHLASVVARVELGLQSPLPFVGKRRRRAPSSISTPPRRTATFKCLEDARAEVRAQELAAFDLWRRSELQRIRAKGNAWASPARIVTPDAARTAGGNNGCSRSEAELTALFLVSPTVRRSLPPLSCGTLQHLGQQQEVFFVQRGADALSPHVRQPLVPSSTAIGTPVLSTKLSPLFEEPPRDTQAWLKASLLDSLMQPFTPVQRTDERRRIDANRVLQRHYHAKGAAHLSSVVYLYKPFEHQPGDVSQNVSAPPAVVPPFVWRSPRRQRAQRGEPCSITISALMDAVVVPAAERVIAASAAASAVRVSQFRRPPAVGVAAELNSCHVTAIRPPLNTAALGGLLRDLVQQRFVQ